MEKMPCAVISCGTRLEEGEDFFGMAVRFDVRIDFQDFPFAIDDERGAFHTEHPGALHNTGLENTINAAEFHVIVAQKRKREMILRCEFALGIESLNAGPDDTYAEFDEFLIMIAKITSHANGLGGVVSREEKEYKQGLEKVAQRDFLSIAGRHDKVRRGLANLKIYRIRHERKLSSCIHSIEKTTR